jgi:hypothetical protein
MRGSFLANAFRANAFRWIPAKSHRLFIKYAVIDDCTRVRVLAVYGFAKHLRGQTRTVTASLVSGTSAAGKEYHPVALSRTP